MRFTHARNADLVREVTVAEWRRVEEGVKALMQECETVEGGYLFAHVMERYANESMPIFRENIKKAVGVVLVEDAELLERLRSPDEEEEVRD